jgi:hypothetical protein
MILVDSIYIFLYFILQFHHQTTQSSSSSIYLFFIQFHILILGCSGIEFHSLL